jgi:hypothetical protein
MRKILFFIAFAATIWSDCKTSDPPDGGFDSPVFMVGMEDSIRTDLTAGVNGTYLFTRVKQGSDKILVMSGAFANASCPAGDCPESVQFEFRNSELGNSAVADLIFQEGANWRYRPDLTNDSLQLHTVAIQWVKPNGSVLRSDLILQAQSDSGYFRILSSEPWALNERGETTWKMNIDFSCWMFDSIQSQPYKIIGSGVIAVGYR